MAHPTLPLLAGPPVGGDPGPNNTNEVVNGLLTALEDVLGRLTQNEQATGLLSEHLKALGGTTHLIDAEVRAMAQDRLTVVMGEAREEMAAAMLHHREQLTYSVEIESREMRKTMNEMGNRLESCERLIASHADEQRRLADLEEKASGMSMRVENLHGELLRRDGGLGSVKARMDNIDTGLAGFQTTVQRSIEELRGEVETRATIPDVSRFEQRIEQIGAECRSMRATVGRTEAQVADMKSLHGVVQDLNDRITSTIAEFENTTLTLGGENGEITGRLENLSARMGTMEAKNIEAARATQVELVNLSDSIRTNTESLVSTQCNTLESKVAIKLDSVLTEGKTWRDESRSLMQIIEDKLDDHDQAIQNVTSLVEGSISERLQATQTDIRELGRRFDNAVVDRTDATQEMRRQLSLQSEIASGLQQQYDSMFKDSMEKHEAWTGVSHDLRLRSERLETQMAAWENQIHTSLDEVRKQTHDEVMQNFGGINSQMESMSRDFGNFNRTLSRLDSEGKMASNSMMGFNATVTDELDEVRKTYSQMSQDVLACKARMENLESRLQLDSQNMARAVMNLDTDTSNQLGEIRSMISERETEAASLKRSIDSVDYTASSKASELESRLASVIADKSNSSERREQYERIEEMTRSVQSHTEETKASLIRSISGIQDQYAELSATISSLTSATGKIDPAVKRLDNQLNAIQRQQKEFSLIQDRLSNEMVETQTESTEMRGQISVMSTKVDMFSSKPLATEQAVKNMQNNLKTEITRLGQELNTVQTSVQESHEQLALESSNRHKSMASAMLEFKHKIDNLECNQRDSGTAQSTLIDDLRASNDETTDAIRNKIETLQREASASRNIIQRLEGETREVRAVKSNFDEVSGQMLGSIDELRGNTSTLASTLGNLNARVEKSDSTTRENVADLQKKVSEFLIPTVQDTQEKLNDKCGSLENKISTESEYTRGMLSATKGHVEEHRKALQVVVQRQETVEKLHQFGIKTTTDLRDQLEQFETEQARKLDLVRTDLDRHVRNITQSYDTKLRSILAKEEVQTEIKQMTSMMTSDMKSELEDLGRRTEADFASLATLFGLSRSELGAAVEGGHDSRTKLLHKKPAFANLIAQIDTIRSELNAATGR